MSTILRFLCFLYRPYRLLLFSVLLFTFMTSPVPPVPPFPDGIPDMPANPAVPGLSALLCDMFMSIRFILRTCLIFGDR